MYDTNELVLYGTEGVCKITGIETKTIDHHRRDYYVLSPVDSARSTIYVPMDNQKLLGKMRPILTAPEVDQLVHSLPAGNPMWIEDESQRKETYREVLRRGNPSELLQMIKALYLHQKRQQAKGRHLHIADENYFHMAEKLVYEEFAAALQIEQNQVVPYLLAQIGEQPPAAL
jgi:CarD family transcriptional regulator